MKKRVGPISPDKVAKAKKMNFPNAVFEAFNELIAQHFSDGSATIEQDDVLKLMEKKGLKREKALANNWLDVEKIYEAAGWTVEYDAPGYCESYPATFTFSTS